MSFDNYTIKVRDQHTNETVFSIKDCPETKALQLLNTFINKKKGSIRRCPLNLHNWPDTKLDTKCLDCGLTVRRFRSEKEMRKLQQDLTREILEETNWI